MEKEMIERLVIDSIEAAWPEKPVPSLKLYTYHIDASNKIVKFKVFLDVEISENEREDIWDIDVELSTHLPDDWSTSTVFIVPKSDQFLTCDDRIAFRRGESVTPKDRYRIRFPAVPLKRAK